MLTFLSYFRGLFWKMNLMQRIPRNPRDGDWWVLQSFNESLKTFPSSLSICQPLNELIQNILGGVFELICSDYPVTRRDPEPLRSWPPSSVWPGDSEGGHITRSVKTKQEWQSFHGVRTTHLIWNFLLDSNKQVMIVKTYSVYHVCLPSLTLVS